MFNRKYIFKGSISHCYVSLPECMSMENLTPFVVFGGVTTSPKADRPYWRRSGAATTPRPGDLERWIRFSAKSLFKKMGRNWEGKKTIQKNPWGFLAKWTWGALKLPSYKFSPWPKETPPSPPKVATPWSWNRSICPKSHQDNMDTTKFFQPQVWQQEMVSFHLWMAKKNEPSLLFPIKRQSVFVGIIVQGKLSFLIFELGENDGGCMFETRQMKFIAGFNGVLLFEQKWRHTATPGIPETNWRIKVYVLFFPWSWRWKMVVFKGNYY